MAQKVQTILVDDLEDVEIPDGGGETVTFGLDGVTYEIDLTTRNAETLRRSVRAYAEHGRTVRGRRPTAAAPTAPPRRPTKDYDTAAVKAWAASHKVDVPRRGRIPKAVIEQFRAAGN